MFVCVYVRWLGRDFNTMKGSLEALSFSDLTQAVLISRQSGLRKTCFLIKGVVKKRRKNHVFIKKKVGKRFIILTPCHSTLAESTPKSSTVKIWSVK